MFDLSRYLPYLLNRAGSHVAAAFTREVRGQGITLPVWRVLAALNHRNGQRLGELSEMTAIEVSTLSRVLDLMQGKGLVARKPGPDARSISVQLTAAGRAATRRIVPIARRYETEALAGFTKAEADRLRGYLHRLYANMKRRNRRRELAAAE